MLQHIREGVLAWMTLEWNVSCTVETLTRIYRNLESCRPLAKDHFYQVEQSRKLLLDLFAKEKRPFSSGIFRKQSRI